MNKSNPYSAPDKSFQDAPQRKAVRGYLVASGILLTAGMIAAMPSLVLLNQERQFIATNGNYVGFMVDGQPIADETAIQYCLGTGVAFSCLAMALAAKGILNYKHNRSAF